MNRKMSDNKKTDGRKAFLIYSRFLNEKTGDIYIGGIETYILNLARVFIKAGCIPSIFQLSETEFETHYQGIRVVGLKKGVGSASKAMKKLVKVVEGEMEGGDLIVFGTEEISVKTKKAKAIILQHGVSWDVPNNNWYVKNIVRNVARSLREWRQLRNASKVVCVDYNFCNWYRATYKSFSPKKFITIPNFCVINGSKQKEQSEMVKILFARRFVEHRGSLLFAEVAKNLVGERDNVIVCFSGEGPCEEKIKSILNGSPRIEYGKFRSDESVDFQSKFDIAVVPTLGSEGTSLSLLEGMSAGCAMVTTAVGGLSNIVIDGYNGIIAEPSKESIEAAVLKLVDNPELRRTVAQKGFETVSSSFSIAIWERRWMKLLSEM